MKKVLLFLLVSLNGVMLLAQASTGSMSISLRLEETRENFEDSVSVSLTGKIRRTLHLKPDSNGTVLISKLPYGEYSLILRAKDHLSEKLAGIIINGDKPVFLEFRLKSSMIRLDLELLAYRTPLVQKTADSWKTSSYKSRREEAVRDSLYNVRRQEQKKEHQSMEQGSWKMTDSLRNKSVTHLQDWYEYMQKNLNYPQDAIDMGIDAKVYIGFETDDKGAIQNLKLLRGHDPELAVELLHAVNKAPGIFPPKNETGKPLRQKYILSVNFRLE